MPPQAKAEALKALASVKAMLDDLGAPLARRQVAAILDYAMEQVAAIEELKRTRRSKPGKVA